MTDDGVWADIPGLDDIDGGSLDDEDVGVSPSDDADTLWESQQGLSRGRVSSADDDNGELAANQAQNNELVADEAHAYSAGKVSDDVYDAHEESLSGVDPAGHDPEDSSEWTGEQLSEHLSRLLSVAGSEEHAVARVIAEALPITGVDAIAPDPATTLWRLASTDPIEGFVDPSYLRNSAL